MDSHPQDAQDVEKNEHRPNTTAETDDKQEYPPFWQLVLLTTALCMAMLLVSLVSPYPYPPAQRSTIPLRPAPLLTLSYSYSGRHHPRHRHPPHHQPIRLARRRCLVREFVPLRRVRPATDVRQVLRYVLRQMGVLGWRRHLRDRLPYRWRFPLLGCSYRWKGYFWHGRCGDIRRRYYHPRECGPIEATPGLYWAVG